MDSRQRFVLIYAALAFIPYMVLTFLNTSDIGLYISSYAILYFALRLALNPRIRIKVDVIGIVLLAFLAFYLSERIMSILFP